MSGSGTFHNSHSRLALNHVSLVAAFGQNLTVAAGSIFRSLFLLSFSETDQLISFGPFNCFKQWSRHSIFDEMIKAKAALTGTLRVFLNPPKLIFHTSCPRIDKLYSFWFNMKKAKLFPAIMAVVGGPEKGDGQMWTKSRSLGEQPQVACTTRQHGHSGLLIQAPVKLTPRGLKKHKRSCCVELRRDLPTPLI